MKDLFKDFDADNYYFCTSCEKIHHNEDARYSDPSYYYSSWFGQQMDDGDLEGCRCGASWREMKDVDFEIFVKHGEAIGW